jgi:hypothetical protein
MKKAGEEPETLRQLAVEIRKMQKDLIQEELAKAAKKEEDDRLNLLKNGVGKTKGPIQ